MGERFKCKKKFPLFILAIDLNKVFFSTTSIDSFPNMYVYFPKTDVVRKNMVNLNSYQMRKLPSIFINNVNVYIKVHYCVY